MMNKEAEILSLPVVDKIRDFQSIRDGMKYVKEKYTIAEVEMSIQSLKHMITRQDISTEYRHLLLKDLRELKYILQILTGVFFI